MRALLNEEESKLLKDFSIENNVFVELDFNVLSRTYNLYSRDFKHNLGMEINVNITEFETNRIKMIEHMLKEVKERRLKHIWDKLVEQGELCNHCPCTEFGTEDVNTNQYNQCEGCCCKEALENYLEDEMERES